MYTQCIYLRHTLLTNRNVGREHVSQYNSQTRMVGVNINTELLGTKFLLSYGVHSKRSIGDYVCQWHLKNSMKLLGI